MTTIDKTIEELETCLLELPLKIRANAYSVLSEIYANFANTLLTEQAAGVTTGLAQATYRENAIIKVDLELHKQYKKTSEYFKKCAQPENEL